MRCDLHHFFWGSAQDRWFGWYLKVVKTCFMWLFLPKFCSVWGASILFAVKIFSERCVSINSRTSKLFNFYLDANQVGLRHHLLAAWCAEEGWATRGLATCLRPGIQHVTIGYGQGCWPKGLQVCLAQTKQLQVSWRYFLLDCEIVCGHSTL